MIKNALHVIIKACLFYQELSMKTKPIVLIAVLLIFSIPYFAGLKSVPFHPDESTQIYTSEDVNFFFKNPALLFWNPDSNDQRQIYRLIDSPLSRNIIGIGRMLTHQPTISNDWDWSKTWDENVTAGALPNETLLLISRLSLSIFFPLSLLFMYRAAQKSGGQIAAWSALLLTATNAYLLLHSRRAMSEGILFFAISLFAWGLFSWRKHPWLLALPAALAFSAKYSSLPLAFIGFLSILWPDSHCSWQQRLLNGVRFSLLLGVLVFALHPIFWQDPFHAIPTALQNRQTLVTNQVSTLASIQPDQILNSPLERLSGFIIQLFLAPLAIADVGNYLAQTQASANAYLANPFNTLLRSLGGGGILLALTLIGPLLGTINVLRHKRSPRPLILLCLTIIVQLAFLIKLVPLPFQRYAMPLLPWCILCQALAIQYLLKNKSSPQN
jgi:hypothetical protein